MSIDTDCYCDRCYRLIDPDDKQYKIPYKRFEGLPPDEILLCESCFRALLEEHAKKAEEAAAREKKSRKFWFFGRKKNQKGDK
ncbi:MAG: hypothetical protein II008_11860 [Oscillospiraceae bacterium]|nr:hypothetical protein [Oscillospiraceae bacterium]